MLSHVKFYECYTNTRVHTCTHPHENASTCSSSGSYSLPSSCVFVLSSLSVSHTYTPTFQYLLVPVVAFFTLICRHFFASLLCNDMIMVCLTILHRHFRCVSVVQFHKNSIRLDSYYVVRSNILLPSQTPSHHFTET